MHPTSHKTCKQKEWSTVFNVEKKQNKTNPTNTESCSLPNSLSEVKEKCFLRPTQKLKGICCQETSLQEMFLKFSLENKYMNFVKWSSLHKGKWYRPEAPIYINKNTEQVIRKVKYKFLLFVPFFLVVQ